ncbi:MAG: hypothetical protein ACXAES_16240 [Promethearchaeota archaeon]|jgi:hypothetical protein
MKLFKEKLTGFEKVSGLTFERINHVKQIMEIAREKQEQELKGDFDSSDFSSHTIFEASIVLSIGALEYYLEKTIEFLAYSWGDKSIKSILKKERHRYPFWPTLNDSKQLIKLLKKVLRIDSKIVFKDNNDFVGLDIYFIWRHVVVHQMSYFNKTSSKKLTGLYKRLGRESNFTDGKHHLLVYPEVKKLIDILEYLIKNIDDQVRNKYNIKSEMVEVENL